MKNGKRGVQPACLFQTVQTAAPQNCPKFQNLAQNLAKNLVISCQSCTQVIPNHPTRLFSFDIRKQYAPADLFQSHRAPIGRIVADIAVVCQGKIFALTQRKFLRITLQRQIFRPIPIFLTIRNNRIVFGNQLKLRSKIFPLALCCARFAARSRSQVSRRRSSTRLLMPRSSRKGTP